MQMYEGRAQVALRPKTTQQVSQVWHRPAPQDFQQGSLHLLQSTMPVPRDHMLHAGWVSTLAWDVPDLLLQAMWAAAASLARSNFCASN